MWWGEILILETAVNCSAGVRITVSLSKYMQLEQTKLDHPLGEIIVKENSYLGEKKRKF
jgi:hypothetical protein